MMEQMLMFWMLQMDALFGPRKKPEFDLDRGLDDPAYVLDFVNERGEELDMPPVRRRPELRIVK